MIALGQIIARHRAKALLLWLALTASLLAAAAQAQPAASGAAAYSLHVETRLWSFGQDTLASSPDAVTTFDQEARALALDAFAAACLPPPPPAPHPLVPPDGGAIYELFGLEIAGLHTAAEASIGTLGPEAGGNRSVVWDTLTTARASRFDPPPAATRADLLRLAAAAIVGDVLTRYGEPPPEPGTFAIYPSVSCSGTLTAQVPAGGSVVWYNRAGHRIGEGPALASSAEGPVFAVLTRADRSREVRRGHLVRLPQRITPTRR